MNKILLSTCISIIFVQTLVGQRQILRPDNKFVTDTEIDSIAQGLMDNAGVTGLSIGIINDNKIDYIKCYGYSNKADGRRTDTATCLYAASLSKPVFSYLVMQLVDKGLINLDTPVYKYLPKPLPEYENYKNLAGDKRWKLITARQCLSHTTGFPNWRQLNPKGTQKLEIFFTPGTRYAYSGEGLYLLQLIVETITHEKLEDLASKQIFRPLGMTRTSFIWQKSFDADYAVGHNNDENALGIFKRTEANAAGSMETTISDYTRFFASVLLGIGISSASKQEMLSPQIRIFTKHQFPSLNNDTTSNYKNIQLSYGLGWGLFKSVYGWAFFKEGHSDDGWEHYTIGFPDKKYAVVVMTNSMNGESIFKELLEKMSAVTIPWEWEGFLPYTPVIKLPNKILEQYAGYYVGRTTATISLVNGQLKIESKVENLPATNLYAKDSTHFFMKAMSICIEFIKGNDGKFKTINVNDEGELYRLNKNDTTEAQTFNPSLDILRSYVGTYLLNGNKKRKLVIELQGNSLIAKLPGQGAIGLIFLTDTNIKFKSVLDIKGAFIKENGVTTKLIIEQDGKYEWEKVQ